jgi:uncharacterized protein (DUF4415 family)
MKKKYDFKNAKRGAVVPQKGKTRITIFIDTDILDQFRNLSDGAGFGYQTMINETLRLYLGKPSKPIDETTLRQVLREELKRIAH